MQAWKIKKAVGTLGLTVVLILGGCLGKNGDKKEINAPGNSSVESSDVTFLEDEGISWQDNFLDDLHATVNLPVERVMPEGALDGGTTNFFISEGGGVLFQNHLYEDSGKNWSGVSGVTTEGERIALRLEADLGRNGMQFYVMGPISGKNGYVACCYEFKDGKPCEYWFYELDEEFKKVHSVRGEVEDSELIRFLAGDANGNFHATFQRSGGEGVYLVVSPEGKTVFEAELGSGSQGHAPELCAYGGGRVAVCGLTYKNGTVADRRFYEANLERGGLREMTISRAETIRSQMQKYVYAATPVSEEELAWCDPAGIFVYDGKTGETREVYKWSNHGIVPKNVFGLSVMTDGSVGLFYDLKDGRHYLFLRTTEERKELPSITIAVSPYGRNEFETMAAYFKQEHPGYVVNIIDDYDETSLLTQLGAGEGPVLVDTSLTGFEELEHLWQPLDGFLEQTGLKEEMLSEVLDFGKIGDVTYGIVREFRIETLLASDSTAKDWDYAGFLDALEKIDGGAFTYEYLESSADWRDIYFDALQNGLEDNYYFDAETGRTIFGTTEFERVLRLAGKAAKCPPPENGKAMQEGRVLCEYYTIMHPAVAFRLRRRLEANGEQAAGYPTKDGARHLLVARAPLAMRSTASEEEKQIAYTFLKTCLSEEVMNATCAQFPVRKDVLERQIEEYERTAKSIKEDGAYGPNYMPVLDRDRDVPFLYDLIENGVVEKSFPAGLQRVFDEELGDYLAGRIDGKALEEHLRSRVWLYLEESK